MYTKLHECMCCFADGHTSESAKNALQQTQSIDLTPAETAGGSIAYVGADIEAVLDKLTMMEKRHESIAADNKHQMLALAAQYDSLTERLNGIEQFLSAAVATTDL